MHPSPEVRRALVVMLVATAIASVFVSSYSLALGRPTPRDIPAGLVGDAAAGARAVAAVQHGAQGSLRFRAYATEAAARGALERQDVYAVLVVGGGAPRMLIAIAAGVSVARLLEQAVQAASQQLGTPVQLVDVRPLPPGDPQGLVSFYLTLAATVLGFVTMFQLRTHAGGLSLRQWTACLALLALGGGLVLTVVVGPLIGALEGPFVELWLVVAAEIAVAGLFNSTMLVLLGSLAIIPTWLLFVALGNASSGGAVAPPLLPPAYAVIGRVLPQGVTVEMLHTAAYFTDAQSLAPFLIQGAWLVGLSGALVLAARLRGRGPTGRAED